MRRLHVLWIGTKPPLPPRDGGRLLTWATLQGLAALGHRITFVAPRLDLGGDAAERLRAVVTPHLVDVSPPSTPRAALRSVLGRRPLSIARHSLPAMADAVEGLVRARAGASSAIGGFDLVHVEQLQAAAAARPARRRGLPIVLRAQNVESDLWRGVAGSTRPPLRWALGAEATRLRRAEARIVAAADAVAALTRADADRLETLSGRAVTVVPAASPLSYPAGDRPLPGDPPVVVFGSAGWRPNRDGAEWFLRAIWPTIRERVPTARLHLFGEVGSIGGRDEEHGVDRRPTPTSSSEALPPGAVLAVPLHVASGVRMKILEAWARGIPVIATPRAAAGLACLDEAGGLPPALDLAETATAFADAVMRLRDPEIRDRRVSAGRACLERFHAPDAVARRLVALYASVV
ncbi:MAG: glycosyltransferase family 4 protein [Acidobacteriota bacterium]